MLRIGQVEATATQDGKYTDGSVAGGIAATRLRAAAFNAMQEELAHIVESAGLTLDINDMTQVLKAIQKLTLSRTNPFADIKSDGAAAISTALTNLGLQYSISEPDTETVVYTLPGGYKLMAFNRLVNNSTTVGTGVTTPITFPQAFPSRLIAAFATKKNYVQAAVSCENQSLTGFDAVVTLITTIAGGITSTRAMFFAIGK
ncbi:gp53-like domain-containing protein [Enterobacter asburiae]|uniref:gp53-like domain-containing protein n=1 Tax=Enterobacter asburiae TaxID=61645 RepID=UPI003D6E0DF4